LNGGGGRGAHARDLLLGDVVTPRVSLDGFLTAKLPRPHRVGMPAIGGVAPRFVIARRNQWFIKSIGSAPMPRGGCHFASV